MGHWLLVCCHSRTPPADLLSVLPVCCASQPCLAAWNSLGAQEAIRTVQAEARAKFDESVELHMCLGIDPRRGDQVRRAALVWGP